MEWVEAGGKTLAEAKEIALDHLGVAEDDAEFVVLSEPRAGLFGRQRGEARVKARVRPVAPPPKRARRQRTDGRRNSRSDGARRNGTGRGERGRSANESGRSRSGSSGSRKGRAEGDTAAANAKQDQAETNGGVATATGTGGSGRSRRRRSRGGQGANNGEALRSENGRKPAKSAGGSEDTMEESLTLAQQGEAAREFVAGLVQEFGLQADVSYEEIDEDTVLVAATGDDLGLLVGPRGATLAAVQDLTRTFVQRQSETRTDRILVDVGGYREKRAAALRRFTDGIVEEVRSTGAERALEPMSPADRKVIHDAVNELDGVETRSEGVEPARYVVIQPAG